VIPKKTIILNRINGNVAARMAKERVTEKSHMAAGLRLRFRASSR
jgi:hypothetical protein